MPVGYVVYQTLPAEPSPAPTNVTFVINFNDGCFITDPKNGSISSSQVLSSHPSYNREEHIFHSTKKSKASQGGDPEQNEASRKNKKKEQSKLKYKVLIVQDPQGLKMPRSFPVWHLQLKGESETEWGHRNFNLDSSH